MVACHPRPWRSRDYRSFPTPSPEMKRSLCLPAPSNPAWYGWEGRQALAGGWRWSSGPRCRRRLCLTQTMGRRRLRGLPRAPRITGSPLIREGLKQEPPGVGVLEKCVEAGGGGRGIPSERPLGGGGCLVDTHGGRVMWWLAQEEGATPGRGGAGVPGQGTGYGHP